MSKILVIGYGNDLRGDDAVGRKVAEKIENLNIPDVKTLNIHQITPELAFDISQADLVIFADACIDSTDLKVQEILPSEINSPSIGHNSDPSSLLQFSKILYDKLPKAFLIGIPAINFEFTEELSEISRIGIDKAVEVIKGMVN